MIAQDSLFYTNEVINIIDSKIQQKNSDEDQSPSIWQKPTQIQTNGPDQLATILHRGQGARHLAILWNGWNLQSPLNGTLDLNLIPPSFYTTTLINDDTNVTLGSASQAGALLLLDKEHNHDISLGYNYTTLKNHQLYGRLSKRGNRLTWSTNFALLNHQNRFSFSDQNTPKVREHNERKGIDLGSSIKLKLNQYQDLNFELWYQQSDRQIAPSITAGYDQSRLIDDNVRFHMQWNRTKGKQSWIVRAAFLSEGIAFNSNIVKQSDTRSRSYRSEVIHHMTTSKLEIKSAIDINLTRAGYTFDEFNGEVSKNQVSRDQFAFWNSLDFTLAKNLSITSNLRSEYYTDHESLLYSSIKLNYQTTQKGIGYSFSRHFQLPNFNDLYWPTGGNKNLQVERGYTHELSSFLKSKWGNIELNAFSTQGRDWILWAPNEIGIWTPENRRSVWSRGLELKHEKKFSFSNKIELNNTLQYAWTKSTLQEESREELNGKQLIYIPEHVVTNTFSLSRKTSLLECTGRYTSHRFISSDNSASVDGYVLIDLAYKQKVRLLSFDLDIIVLVQNVLNSDYEIVKFYPTPLRNYSFGIQIDL